MMRVLADAELILSAFQENEHTKDAEVLLADIMSSKQIELYITDLCLEKISYYDKYTANVLKEKFGSNILPYDNCFIEEEILKAAKDTRDFECAVEVAWAKANNIDAIVTYKPQNFNETILQIWSVNKLLQQINQIRCPNKFLIFPSQDWLIQNLLNLSTQVQVKSDPTTVKAIVERIVTQVESFDDNNSSTKNSIKVNTWKISLAQKRLKNCLRYYQLGSKQGRIELHSTLESMIYLQVAIPNARFSCEYNVRHNFIQTFLKKFYLESLKSFCKEHELPENYKPRVLLELAEYMAFTEEYAKRDINQHNVANQQLIRIRIKDFYYRHFQETVVVS